MRNPNRLRSSDEADELRAAVALACDIVMPEAERLAKVHGRKLHSCISTILRPLIQEHLDPDRPRDTRMDQRGRNWLVHVHFWDTTDEHAELIGESDPETVFGLPAVSDLILEYAQQMHEAELEALDEVPEFSETRMAKRVAGMYPAISRGGGSATTRIVYQLGRKRYYCQADISRA